MALTYEYNQLALAIGERLFDAISDAEWVQLEKLPVEELHEFFDIIRKSAWDIYKTGW